MDLGIATATASLVTSRRRYALTGHGSSALPAVDARGTVPLTDWAIQSRSIRTFELPLCVAPLVHFTDQVNVTLWKGALDLNWRHMLSCPKIYFR